MSRGIWKYPLPTPVMILSMPAGDAAATPGEAYVLEMADLPDAHPEP